MEISSKILSKTDNKRLVMKTSSLNYLPPFVQGQYSQVLSVECEEGIIWPLKLIIRRRGKYKKPVLSAGWIQFFRSKQLQRGFKVIFLSEIDEATGKFRLKIKLKQPVILFNAVMGYKPYHGAR